MIDASIREGYFRHQGIILRKASPQMGHQDGKDPSKDPDLSSKNQSTSYSVAWAVWWGAAWLLLGFAVEFIKLDRNSRLTRQSLRLMTFYILPRVRAKVRIRGESWWPIWGLTLSHRKTHLWMEFRDGYAFRTIWPKSSRRQCSHWTCGFMLSRQLGSMEDYLDRPTYPGLNNDH